MFQKHLLKCLLMKHLTLDIHGLVQGVFFRSNARKVAEGLRISGYVMNDKNGDVHIEAEGGDQDLKTFLDWCHKGPAAAKIERVDVHEGQLVFYKDFEILHHR